MMVDRDAFRRLVDQMTDEHATVVEEFLRENHADPAQHKLLIYRDANLRAAKSDLYFARQPSGFETELLVLVPIGAGDVAGLMPAAEMLKTYPCMTIVVRL